jgi:large subunit ribosomal protein L30
MLKITQVRSLIGSPPKHKLTMKAIGFHRHQETLTKSDSPQLRGMLTQVRHLVSVEEVGSSAGKKTPPAKSEAKTPAKAERSTGAAKAPAKTGEKKSAEKAAHESPGKEQEES